MDAIFTLPYSEYEVINVLKKKLKNSCSFYIPTSRQQKGIDFIIQNNENNKFLKIQVKSSRAFINKPKEVANKRRVFKYNLWFNNFIEKCKDNCGAVDYYLLFGLYPEYEIKNSIRSKNAFWKSIVICFSEKEMIDFLKKIKITKNGNQHKFFGFGFDDVKEIFATTGFKKYKNKSKFLLDETGIERMRKKLKIFNR